MTLYELDEATALSWGDLDISDFAETLKERSELILSYVAGQTTDKDCRVVRVGELVHWLWLTIVAHGWRSAHRVHAWGLHTRSHALCHWHTSRTSASRLVLGCGSGDSHWSVAAVDTLHLSQSALLILLIGKTNETVTARHSRDWVGHDLCRLAGWKACLEKGNEDVFVDFWSEITDEDGEFWSTVITKQEMSVSIVPLGCGQ